ncbi:MAG TPA: L,D-transpeptidase [Acidimicrobiales bacterium]
MASWGLRRPVSTLVAALLSTGALVACSDSGDDEASAPRIAPESAETTTTTLEADGTPPPRTSYVAQVNEEIEVWEEANSADSTTLSPDGETSDMLTFLVVDRRDDGWLEVLLPGPPVGSKGFVREEDVFLSRHRFRIEVSISRNELLVYAGPLEAVRAPAALGPDTPPAGTATYVKELLAPEFMNIYGSPVYGLAGFTNSPEEFKAGSGVAAIHPVDVSTLGRPAPAGSIGIDPAVLERLTSGMMLPLGTPVDIVE